MLDVFLQRHRDTGMARTFSARLISEFHVPETTCTDKLASDEAAIQDSRGRPLAGHLNSPLQEPA